MSFSECPYCPPHWLKGFPAFKPLPGLSNCLAAAVERAPKATKFKEEKEAQCRQDTSRNAVRVAGGRVGAGTGSKRVGAVIFESRSVVEGMDFISPSIDVGIEYWEWQATRFGMGRQTLAQRLIEPQHKDSGGRVGHQNVVFDFPYPDCLAEYGIAEWDWRRFEAEILRKFNPCGGIRFHESKMRNYKLHTVAKNIETILDNVAEQDRTLFRPRGLIMRMDMPGEKFDWDLWILHFDKVHKLNGKVTKMAGWRDKSKKWPDVQREIVEGVRIVISPLTILQDPKMAERYGWTNWIQQCEAAEANKPKVPEQPIPYLDLQALVDCEDGNKIGEAVSKHYTDLEAYYGTLKKQPLSERVFRWPPSKQLYWDRWRGDTDIYNEKRILVHVKGHTAMRYLERWIPWNDSMDKRMETQWTQRCVLPADDFKPTVLESCPPNLGCKCKAKKRKPTLASHKKTRTQKRIREQWVLYPLMSERDEIWRSLHYKHQHTEHEKWAAERARYRADLEKGWEEFLRNATSRPVHCNGC